MRLYEAVPDGEPRGAVVVIQEAFGVNPHIEDVTRRFADGRLPRGRARHVPPHRAGRRRRLRRLRPGDGALHRRSAATTRSSPTSTPRSATSAASGSPTARSASSASASAGASRSSSRRSARSARPSASTAAASSPRRFPQFPALVDGAATLQTPWLGLFGDHDESIPVDDVEQLRDGARRRAGRHRGRAVRRRRARVPLRRARRRTTPTPRPTRGAGRSTGSARHLGAR